MRKCVLIQSDIWILTAVYFYYYNKYLSFLLLTKQACYLKVKCIWGIFYITAWLHKSKPFQPKQQQMQSSSSHPPHEVPSQEAVQLKGLLPAALCTAFISTHTCDNSICTSISASFIFQFCVIYQNIYILELFLIYSSILYWSFNVLCCSFTVLEQLWLPLGIITDSDSDGRNLLSCRVTKKNSVLWFPRESGNAESHTDSLPGN